MQSYNSTTEQEVEEKKELTTQQKINAQIKELNKLKNIDKKIATMKAKIKKLQEEKKELEEKYSL